MCQDHFSSDVMEIDSTYYSDSDLMDQPAMPPVTHVNYNSILHKVPFEIFEQICVSIEPLWLLNLSHTCHDMFQQLSFKQGNKIWYKSMPPSVWKESEHYQNETELSKLLTSHGSPEHLASEMVVNFMHRRPLAIFSGSPNMSSALTLSGAFSVASPLPPSASTLSIDTRMAQSLDPGYDLSPVRNKYGSTSMGYSLAGFSERQQIQALGGPYQPVFNYKREILGYLKTSERCYICFNLKGSNGESVNTWRWGILFCPDCLKEHTITIGALRKIAHVEGVYPVMTQVTLIPYQTSSTLIFYRPEIDDLVHKATGLHLDTHMLTLKTGQQLVAKGRIERSGLEGHRRIVRRLLVAAAELLWEGNDPSPTEIKDPKTGEITDWQPRECMDSSETFKAFRDRFAPTHKLKSFLFPDYLLEDSPTRLPYDPASGWMEDPTMLLRKKEHFDNLTERWVADRVFEMLIKLTDWRHSSYYHKGYGGFVSNWIGAAKQYHIRRMDAHLKAGATVEMAHVPVELRESYEFRRLRKLRAKCGLQDEKSATMHPLPKRPERGGFVNRYSFDEYVHLDQLAAAAEQERADAIKHFNKIIRHTCVACPDTSLLFYPMGFEALVEHMRLGHARRFWTTDEFHTIG